MRLFREFFLSTSVSLYFPTNCSVKLGSLLTRTSDCLNRNHFDHELHREIDPYHVEHGPTRRYEHTQGNDSHDAAFEHPCSELKKILSDGTFYYSLTFDLTNRLQDRYVKLIITLRVGKSYDLLDCRNGQPLKSIIQMRIFSGIPI